MGASAFSCVTMGEQIFRSTRSGNCCGPKFGRILADALVAAFVLGVASPAWAQTIPTTFEAATSPWNALRLFDPTPLPVLTHPDNREAVAPEDTPVKTRQQPGYEPVGIRDGSWMFLPSVST